MFCKVDNCGFKNCWTALYLLCIHIQLLCMFFGTYVLVVIMVAIFIIKKTTKIYFVLSCMQVFWLKLNSFVLSHEYWEPNRKCLFRIIFITQNILSKNLAITWQLMKNLVFNYSYLASVLFRISMIMTYL